MVLRRPGAGGAGEGGDRRGREKRGGTCDVSATAKKALLACVLVGASSAVDPGIPADYQVLHANVVMRHGQRSRLVKTTTQEFGDNDGVALTQKGQEQCFEIGEQLRWRYMLDEGSTTKIEGLPLFYDADRAQVISSGYDRTLESAAALALGLYPPGQNDTDVAQSTLLWNNHIVLPIHSSDPQNDVVILASDKCPVYEDNWIEFYRTGVFEEKQTEAEDWIAEVYRIFNEEGRTANSFPACWEEVEALKADKLELHAPYNLWDCSRVLAAAEEFQTENFINVATPPADYTGAERGFEYLEELVNWIEDHKYEQALTRRYVGGVYIGQMYTRMSQVVEHVRTGWSETAGRFPGIHITIGHYPTLKGIAGALDIGGLGGIPDYASHFSFELLYNSSASWRDGEDDFAVRIMYQNGSDPEFLHWEHMSPIFDDENSLNIDDGLASARDDVTGIMGWTQWSYLMEHQVAGEPAYYAGGEAEWCADCLATEPDTCLKEELKVMTQQLEEAVGVAADAQEETEAVDDGVRAHHVGLMSMFGVFLGIGIGFCIRPCLDRRNKKAKESATVVGGNRGLEAWPGTNGHNGSFRLGAKNTPTRHVGGANGARAMAVPTSDDSEHGPRHNGDYDGSEDEEDGIGTRIPAFAPTSALGEPVPFPHRRQPSGMVTAGAADSSMMSGVDGGDDGHADLPPNSPRTRYGGDSGGDASAAGDKIAIGGGSWEEDVLAEEASVIGSSASTVEATAYPAPHA